MSDRIYGIHQSQPHDVFSYSVANAKRVGINAELHMLSSYDGAGIFTSNSTQIVFDDKIEYYDEKLLDGRTRRYAMVTTYAVAVAPRSFFGIPGVVENQLAKLGYTEAFGIAAYESRAAFAAELGRAESEVPDITGASKITLLAGLPRYIGPDGNPEDVPQTGSQYARTNSGWQEIDLSQYETTQGTDDKIDAALGSTFNSRNILLTSDTSVFADGEGASSDPTGGTGWYYKNTTGNKINWYFYSGGSDSETLGGLQAANGGYYALVEARNNTSYPMFTIYTKRQNDGSDASWYRSRVVYTPGGNYVNKLSLGTHVLHTPNLKQSVLDDLAVKNPGATFTQLEIDPISTVGPQQTTEELWLMAVSTSSNEPEGQETFVLKENAIFFNSKARSWQYAAIPTQPPAYTTYYRGAFAGSANFPETGHLDEWLIETVEDKMYVWDVEGGTWVKTGTAAEAPTAAVNDYPYQYVYSSLDGSGYGFENAYPEGNWSNTPDGKLQSTGSNSDILSRQIKFATLKTPGDEVTFQCSNNTNAYSRYGFFGLVPGTDNSALSWKVAGQPATGVSWMVSDPADYALIEFQMSYLEPYFGGTTYGYNLGDRRNSTGIGYTGNAGELPVTFRVADDYRIEVFIDGHYHVRTDVVPASGVDIYYHEYGQTGRILEQPTGSGSNIQGGTAPTASGAHYYMSDAAPSRVEATILSSGGGYWLYSDTQSSGTGYNIELTDAEASAARFIRAFQDFTGSTLGDRISAMRPVIAMDAIQLAHTEEDARGYFHSLDLTIGQIQQKMGLFADALVASRAGSIEVTLQEINELLTAAPTSTAQTLVYDGTYAGSESTAIDPSSAFATVLGIQRFSISDTTMTLYFDGTHHTSAFAYTTTGFTVAGGGNQDGSYNFTAPVGTATTLQYDLAAAGVANPSNLVNQFTSGNHPLDLTFTGPGVSPVAVSGELELTQLMQGELQDHLLKFPR